MAASAYWIKSWQNASTESRLLMAAFCASLVQTMRQMSSYRPQHSGRLRPERLLNQLHLHLLFLRLLPHLSKRQPLA